MDPYRDKNGNINTDTLQKDKNYTFLYNDKRINNARFLYQIHGPGSNLFSLIFLTKDPETQEDILPPRQYYFSDISQLEEDIDILKRLRHREVGKVKGGIKNGLSISKRKTGRKSIKKINKKRKSNRTFRKRSK